MQHSHELDKQVIWPLARIVTGAAFIVTTAGALIPSSLYERLLSRQSGASAELIVPLLPDLMRNLAIASLALLVLSVLFGRTIERWFWAQLRWLQYASIPKRHDEVPSPMLTPRRVGLRETSGWMLVCFALVLIFDWPAITGGYFETDDFDMLAVNREASWSELPFIPQNDHIYPLTRILLRGFHSVFGVNAAAYSAFAIGNLALMLTAACMFLASLAVSRLAILTSVAICIGWTMWGEFTSGEYILQAYPILVTFALLIGWSCSQYLRDSNKRYLAATAILVTTACLVNISGFWVACAAVAFSVLITLGSDDNWSIRQLASRLVPMLAVIAIPVVLASMVYWYGYTQPSSSGFLSSAKDQRSLSGFILQVTYFVTTSILSTIIAIPHHLIDFHLLVPGMIGAAIFVCVLAVMSWNPLSRLQRFGVVACSVILAGVAAMVSLGRPEQGLGYVVPPKYLFLGYTWLCVLFGFFIEGCWWRVRPEHRLLLGKVLVGAVMLVWGSHAAASFLGGHGVPFFETTRRGELREHARERGAIAEIRRDVFEPLERSISGMMRFPDLPGKTLCKTYPELAYPWGHEPSLSTFADVLVDEPSRLEFLWPTEHMSTLDVVTANVREEVSPEFLQALSHNRRLQALYFAPAAVRYEPLSRVDQALPLPDQDRLLLKVNREDSFAPFKKETMIENRGDAELRYVIPPEDITTTAAIQLQLDVKTDQTPIEINLSFESDFEDYDAMYPLIYPLEATDGIKISLQPFPEYFLSSKTREVRLRFKTIGTYQLKQFAWVPRQR